MTYLNYPAVLVKKAARPRHCEERSDEAIQYFRACLDCFVASLLAMTGFSVVS